MDLVIIGAGPAGLTAGIYAKIFGLDAVVLNNPEQVSQAMWAHLVTNFPGYESISGMELLAKMKEQAEKAGVKIIDGEVVDIRKGKVITEEKTYNTKAILIATGAQHRKADIDGEDKFLGRGVSYCGVCDGPIFKGKDVVVYGGGDSAMKTSMFLKHIGCNVTLISRNEKLKAADINVEMTKKAGVKFILGKEIKKISGDKLVDRVILSDGKDIKCNGIFIAIGEVPTAELAKNLRVNTDKEGYIIVDENQATSIEGVYAAGDVTNRKLKQIITACAAGARAVYGISRYLKGEK